MKAKRLFSAVCAAALCMNLISCGNGSDDMEKVMKMWANARATVDAEQMRKCIPEDVFDGVMNEYHLSEKRLLAEMEGILILDKIGDGETVKDIRLRQPLKNVTT